MSRTSVSRLTLMLLLTALLLAAPGCSVGRSPEQWLSLSYAGLAAMDQYTFNGSTSIGVEQGVMFKPQTFEGTVVNHEQLTVHADRQEGYNWSPLELMERLERSRHSVEIVKEETEGETGSKTLLLRVREEDHSAKKRWQSQLRQQMEQLSAEALQATESAKQAREDVLQQSARLLNDMLETLQVQAHYDIVVDRNKLVPLKIDEQTFFQYEKDGRAMKESRHTVVRLGQFDGRMAEGR